MRWMVGLYRLVLVVLLIVISVQLGETLTELRGIRTEQVKNTLTTLRALRPNAPYLQEPRRAALLSGRCSVTVEGTVPVEME